jgi:hypothetical protein
MKARLDALATVCPLLQAWHRAATWIPVFDLADRWEETGYDAMSILNFFRGILLEQYCALMERRMTAQWCANVLRMVTPHMWLCDTLGSAVGPRVTAKGRSRRGHKGKLQDRKVGRLHHGRFRTRSPAHRIRAHHRKGILIASFAVVAPRSACRFVISAPRMWAVQGVLAALHERERTGKRRREAAMKDLRAKRVL